MIGGVIGSIVLAIFAIVWYPLKRMMKSRKKKQQAAGENSRSAEREDDTPAS